jgi:hypothetical protein
MKTQILIPIIVGSVFLVICIIIIVIYMIRRRRRRLHLTCHRPYDKTKPLYVTADHCTDRFPVKQFQVTFEANQKLHVIPNFEDLNLEDEDTDPKIYIDGQLYMFDDIHDTLYPLREDQICRFVSHGADMQRVEIDKQMYNVHISTEYQFLSPVNEHVHVPSPPFQDTYTTVHGKKYFIDWIHDLVFDMSGPCYPVIFTPDLVTVNGQDFRYRQRYENGKTFWTDAWDESKEPIQLYDSQDRKIYVYKDKYGQVYTSIY